MKKLKYVKLFENFKMNELDQYFPEGGYTADERVLQGYQHTLLSDIIKKFERAIQRAGGNIHDSNSRRIDFKHEKNFIQYSKKTDIFLSQFPEEYRTAETQLKAPIEFAESLRKGLAEFYGEKKIDYSDSVITMKGVEESTEDEYIFKYILLDIEKK